MDNETKRVREVSAEIDHKFIELTGSRADKEIELELVRKQHECAEIISNELDDFIVILDDGINLIIKIHEVCESVHSETKNGFSFVVLTAKMVSLLLGIRKMIFSGLVDCAKSLYRPLIETIDIFFACLGNEDLSTSFGKKNEMYNNSKFWSEKLAYGKVNKEISQLFNRLEVNGNYMEYFDQKRKYQKSFLSNSIHSSFNSSFVNYIMCTLDGKYSQDLFGKVTTAYPKLLFSLLEDINLVNQVFYLVIAMKKCSELDIFDLDNDDMQYRHFQMKYDYLYSTNFLRLHDICEEYSSALEEAHKMALHY